jgi:integrase
MTTSQNSQFITRSRGQFRIDLRAAVNALPHTEPASNLTFGELARAYLASHYDDSDMQLRKWIDLLGTKCAWSVTPDELTRAGHAMIANAYSPSTVNRNLSQVGSVYRFAKKNLLAPAGFISPTLSLYRYEEPIRRVTLSDDEARRFIDAAGAVKDRRFMALIRLLIETGARRSEVEERNWSEIDLDKCAITVIDTKTSRPRQLFFSPETAELMKRVWPVRNPQSLLFEGRVAGKITEFRKSWDKVRTAVGRQDVRVNDLRHHRAKLLVASGSTIAIASQALGNSSLILYRRYGHLESDSMRDAIQKSWKPNDN